jgi:hypothetical protein
MRKRSSKTIQRRDFLKLAAAGTSALIVSPGGSLESAMRPVSRRPLDGKRILTFNSCIRVNQIEVSRTRNAGFDEYDRHTPENIKALRQALADGWPKARMTWAMSWRSLHDQRDNYKEARNLVRQFHDKYGDDVTFIPGAYFANMYNTREQVNRDIHEGLELVSKMMGGNFRSKSLIAGFLSSVNQQYLAEQEGIHVCQGNIWSQYAIDNGDGDGSICYPYYPSKEHFCKPAQNVTDFIDCVNLDGWTIDFLCGMREGLKWGKGKDAYNSRMGVGPIETIGWHGPEKGLEQMTECTAIHFDKGFELNNWAWVTNMWEISLVPQTRHLDVLTRWVENIRTRWPDAECPLLGDFGEMWRKQYENNDDMNYRFVERGTGIGGSHANLEIRWFMNKKFRLALLRDWQRNTPEKVIDFTRYDIPAEEPQDLQRNWSLMGQINQKQTRPQDKPILLTELPAEDRQRIYKRYKELKT